MSKEHPSTNLQMIPINKIEVLNPRERNGRIFDDIVGNIKTIGLKKPVTVTPRKDANGDEKFLLICGEGRLKAFKSLGEKTIPAMVLVSDISICAWSSIAQTVISISRPGASTWSTRTPAGAPRSSGSRRATR